MDYMLEYSSEAMRQLRAILFVKYQGTGSFDSINRLLADIEGSCKVLKTFPRYGRALNDERLRRIGYRKLVTGDYIVIYSLDDCARLVRIEGVFHHRQNYEGEL